MLLPPSRCRSPGGARRQGEPHGPRQCDSARADARSRLCVPVPHTLRRGGSSGSIRPFVRNLPSRAVVVAAAIVLFAPWVEAASLNVGPPEQIAPGWTRITGRYESAGAEPEFRAIARCGNSQTDAHI